LPRGAREGIVGRMAATRSKPAKPRARRAKKDEAAHPPPPAPATLAGVIARGIEALRQELGVRVPASSAFGLRVGKALLSPEAARMRRDAGRYVRELRELAGLTVDELADALELSDHSLLRAVEKGTATLSFELILRLSALLARNDPVPFVAKLTRSYNPGLWKLLEPWGIGRIPLQLERERRFVNVFRAQDAARELSDEGFDRVLDFTQAAFETALAFAAAEERISPPRKRRRSRRVRPQKV
jgi:transcriptional regulator with XRE-family HTH domain